MLLAVMECTQAVVCLIFLGLAFNLPSGNREEIMESISTRSHVSGGVISFCIRHCELFCCQERWKILRLEK